MPKREYVIGNKYNMLTVIEEVAPKSKYARRFKCLCECGKESVVQLSNMKSGHTKSCGCQNHKGTPTHGMSTSTEYKSYRKMLERCYDPKEIGFHNYGGRGIVVCDRWKECFENFFSDMGKKPSNRHSIDRNDPNGNYTPENCSWETKKHQNNNRTNNIKYEHGGTILTQSQWAEVLGVPYSKIARHVKNGFSFSEIIKCIEKNGTDKIRMKPIVRKYWPRKVKNT